MYQDIGDGDFKVSVFDKNDNNVYEKDYKVHELADVVGKEVADKMIAGEGRDTIVNTPSGAEADVKELSGLDLKVGGEGMRGFYDKMLPKAVESYLKKIDPQAVVGNTEIGAPSHRVEYHVEKAGPTTWAVMNENGISHEEYKTEAEALARADELNNDDTPQTTTVHSVEITPAIRERILAESQPLYMRGGRREANEAAQGSTAGSVAGDSASALGRGAGQARPRVLMGAPGIPADWRPLGEHLQGVRVQGLDRAELGADVGYDPLTKAFLFDKSTVMPGERAEAALSKVRPPEAASESWRKEMIQVGKVKQPAGRLVDDLSRDVDSLRKLEDCLG